MTSSESGATLTFMIEMAIWILTLLLSASAEPAPAPRAADFEKDVQPILLAHCQPCHFQGGKMYAKLPFDRPETIDTLGKKLFTRIKDEEEQRVIQSFLDRK